MFADYGKLKKYLKKAKRIVKAPVKVIKRAGKMTIGTVRAIGKGDIKTAGRNLMTLANPISAVTSIVTDDKRKLDWARATMPTSVGAIQNRKLRKQVAVGYVAAAVVAVTIYAAPAVTGAMKGKEALAAAKLAKDAKSVVDLASLGKSLIKGDREGDSGEGQERAGVDTGQQLQEKEIKHTPWLMYGGITVGVITITGLIYYLIKK